MKQSEWTQYSAKCIKLKASGNLNHTNVSSLAYQLFRENHTKPAIEKTLNNGISKTRDGWLIQIRGTELPFHGPVYTQLKVEMNGETFIRPIRQLQVVPACP